MEEKNDWYARCKQKKKKQKQKQRKYIDSYNREKKLLMCTL